MQADNGPKSLGFFGTRNMGMTHQKLVEILSYAMVSTVRSAVCCAARAARRRRPPKPPSSRAVANNNRRRPGPA